MKHPILVGAMLMTISFLATGAQTAVELDDERVIVVEEDKIIVQEEKRKEYDEAQKICAKKIETQQRTIADKLKQIKRDLNKIKNNPQ